VTQAHGAPAPSDDVSAVLAFLASLRGVDFRDYRRDAVERAVHARLVATSSGDLAAYLRVLARDPVEVERLAASLVVPVSSFFRDPEVFAALEHTVLPDLLARPSPLRAWSVGVATGEEAWSLAMLLVVAAERQEAPAPSFDLIASDLDARSLSIARAARYPAAAVAHLPPALRDRFLRPDGDAVRVEDSLRPVVRFSLHDVLGRRLAPPDAVVASFRLVLFRNVLLYFDERLRRKALGRLLSVLEPGGALVLGGVEVLPREVAERFEPFPGVDPALRIHRLLGAR
jgi:two-component system, chemotaxis family, CheB/CheR fusion protein